LLTLIRLAARTKAWVSGHSLAAILGSNPAGDMDICFCKCCVLSGTGVCDGPISRQEDSYRVCVCVCVSLSVIKSDNKHKLKIIKQKMSN